MPVFIPSCVVNFKIRFDESFTAEEVPEPQTTGDSANNPHPIGKLDIRPLIMTTPVFGPFGPTPGHGNLSQVLNRIPKTATVELPGYRTAGKFSMTLAFQDLPIDPRLVRSCGVEVHLGAITATNFGKGMTQANADGARDSVLKTSESTMLLAGVVDNWAVEHTDKGSVINMDGRDLRGLFLDAKANPAIFRKLDLSKPIDNVVQQILDRHPQGDKFRGLVTVNQDDWPIQLGPFGPRGVIPSPVTKDGITRVRRDASGSGSGTSMPQASSSNLSYWDLITQYCFLVGAVPYFQGYKLMIRPARSLYDHQKLDGIDPNRFPTPFKDGAPRESFVGNPATKTQFSIRKFVYGRDVLNMKFERKFQGVKAGIIRCVSIDTSSGKRGLQKLIEAHWPDKKIVSRTHGAKKAQQSVTTSVAPSGLASQSDVRTIPIAGISDVNRLREIAKDIYEEVGRGEMGGSVTTKSLHSFGGPEDDQAADHPDPDVLLLRPGDPIELSVDARALSSRSPLVSELTDNTRASNEELIRRITQKIGDENLARVLVLTARGGIKQLQNFFRVANVKYDWSNSGVQIAFDFQNYVEARHDVTTSTGENIRAKKKAS